jgi:lysophospholipase
VRPNCPPPYVALAHSMGSNILLRGAQNENCVFERMVLISPMIVIHDAMLRNSVGLARAYSEVASLIGLATTYVKGGSNEASETQDFESNRLTSDYVRWSRNKAILEQAPELGLGSPTIGWLRSALRSCALLQRHDYPKYVSVPMLMFAAGADQVVSPRAIEDFAVELKIGGYVAMPGSRHEILQESDAIRQRFWAAFDAYMGVEIPGMV